MGSCRVLECSAMAVATQGCASCSRVARPAARNSPAPRLTFQLMESGPKSPPPFVGNRLASSRRRSNSVVETKQEGAFELSLRAPAFGREESAFLLLAKEADPSPAEASS